MIARLFSHSSAPFAIAAAALAAVPATATAQAIPAGVGGSLAFSKSEAILGAPSALEAILAEQHASPRVSGAIQPSAYTLPRLIPAIVRTRPVDDEGVLSGKPDVFGSVALRVTHTPLDARWRKAENSRLSGEPARYAEWLRDVPPIERLRAVNRYVNRRVRFESDEQQFGRADVWSTADYTLRAGRGDCEDYAIAKLQMLRTAGISDRDLYLVILHDLVRREDHAVLVVRAAGRMLLLDNGTDELLDSADVSDYRPVLTFASYGEWTHGYRVSRPTMTIASNDQADMPAAGDSGDQRSRSASLLAFNTGLRR